MAVVLIGSPQERCDGREEDRQTAAAEEEAAGRRTTIAGRRRRRPRRRLAARGGDPPGGGDRGRRRERALRLPRSAWRALADLRRAPDRSGRADAVPARSLRFPRRAALLSDGSARALSRS